MRSPFRSRSRPGTRAALAAAAALAVLLALARHASAEDAVWKRIGDPPYPPVLYAPCAVYDSLRDRFVVYDPTPLTNVSGGIDYSTHVWEFQPAGPLAGWRLLPTVGTPPPGLIGCNVVLDRPGDRIVVFGGEPLSSYPVYPVIRDAWQLTLGAPATWSPIPAVTDTLRVRSRAIACLDEPAHRLVVYGGLGGFGDHLGALEDTWALPLSGAPVWERLDVAGPFPPSRYGAATGYDPARRRLLLHGGQAEFGGALSDTWALSLGDTLGWQEIATSGLQIPRQTGAGFVDAPRDRFLLAPGWASGYTINNTVYQLPLEPGGTWSEAPAASPYQLSSYAYGLALDSRRDRLALIERQATSAFALDDASGWSGLWPPDPVLAPATLTNEILIDDPAHRRVWSVGGYESMGKTGLWSLDPSGDASWTWHRLPVPLGTSGQTAALDAARGRILVYGAFTGVVVPDSVVAITLADPPTVLSYAPRDTAPPERVEHSMIVDPVGDRLIVYGGQRYLAHFNGYSYGDVWAAPLADLSGWYRVTTAGPTPGPRGGHFAFYDDVGARMIVIGGNSQTGGPRRHVYDEAWALSLDATPTWTALDIAAWRPPATGSLSYDPATHRLWLYHTDPADPQGSATVWVRGAGDSDAWRLVQPLGAGPGIAAKIAYASWCGRLVVVSTGHDPLLADETWALDFRDPVPALASLVGLDAAADHVTIEWEIGPPVPGVVELSRRDADGPWTTLAQLIPDGAGRVRWTDRDVAPGARLGYRIAGGGRTLAETSVDVPTAPSLSFVGAVPQPSRGAMALAFSLPTDADVRLELYDVRGARRLTRDLGIRTAGTHRWVWAETASLPPGLYVARLVTGGGRREVKVVHVP